jgi:hypothetical protein
MSNAVALLLLVLVLAGIALALWVITRDVDRIRRWKLLASRRGLSASVGSGAAPVQMWQGGALDGSSAPPPDVVRPKTSSANRHLGAGGDAMADGSTPS